MAQQPTSSKPAADAAQATSDAARAADDAAHAADDAARAADRSARAERVIVERPVVYEPFGRPIVYEVTRRGRGKRKYSRGMKDPQRVEEGITRSLERLTDGVADGVAKYRRRRDNSARKKRDGAMKDGLRNIGRGLETALRRSAKAPTELTRPLTLRRVTRLLPVPFPRFMR
ncbi:MAG TPA: hypothetical protein VLE27_06355 [Thermoanaerobaculia bacterium]|nr:hypothetical protein [Thermoanaerobaculia bacterium]